MMFAYFVLSAASQVSQSSFVGSSQLIFNINTASHFSHIGIFGFVDWVEVRVRGWV